MGPHAETKWQELGRKLTGNFWYEHASKRTLAEAL
jgi:hypothetical protein